MIGSGKQAKTQLQAVCKVRPITSARIFSRDADKLLAFTTEMSSELGIPVEASQSAEAAVRDAEIVITATTAREPVLFGEWLSPGSHVNLIGSNMLSKAEADVEVFRRAEVITIDSRDQARLECGDFIKAIEAKLFNWGDVPEFAQLLMGHYAGRMNDQQITVFKSLGIGIQDVAVAAKIFELATQQGLGQHLPIG
jgi:ornithine cyclodeaminase/alanine dehydrogenase-like protein (mu-crystallin family)